MLLAPLTSAMERETSAAPCPCPLLAGCFMCTVSSQGHSHRHCRDEKLSSKDRRNWCSACLWSKNLEPGPKPWDLGFPKVTVCEVGLKLVMSLSFELGLVFLGKGHISSQGARLPQRTTALRAFHTRVRDTTQPRRGLEKLGAEVS